MIIFRHSAQNSAANPGDRLTLTFDGPVELGTGRIFYRNVTDWREREIAADGPRASCRGPGPPDIVTGVGFLWESSSIPEGVSVGDPLTLKIAPNQASGDKPGYLDIDNLRVTVIGR